MAFAAIELTPMSSACGGRARTTLASPDADRLFRRRTAESQRHRPRSGRPPTMHCPRGAGRPAIGHEQGLDHERCQRLTFTFGPADELRNVLVDPASPTCMMRCRSPRPCGGADVEGREGDLETLLDPVLRRLVLTADEMCLREIGGGRGLDRTVPDLHRQLVGRGGTLERGDGVVTGIGDPIAGRDRAERDVGRAIAVDGGEHRDGLVDLTLGLVEAAVAEMTHRERARGAGGRHCEPRALSDPRPSSMIAKPASNRARSRLTMRTQPWNVQRSTSLRVRSAARLSWRALCRRRSPRRGKRRCRFGHPTQSVGAPATSGAGTRRPRDCLAALRPSRTPAIEAGRRPERRHALCRLRGREQRGDRAVDRRCARSARRAPRVRPSVARARRANVRRARAAGGAGGAAIPRAQPRVRLARPQLVGDETRVDAARRDPRVGGCAATSTLSSASSATSCSRRNWRPSTAATWTTRFACGPRRSRRAPISSSTVPGMRISSTGRVSRTWPSLRNR